MDFIQDYGNSDIPEGLKTLGVTTICNIGEWENLPVVNTITRNKVRTVYRIDDIEPYFNSFAGRRDGIAQIEQLEAVTKRLGVVIPEEQFMQTPVYVSWMRQLYGGWFSQYRARVQSDFGHSPFFRIRQMLKRLTSF